MRNSTPILTGRPMPSWCRLNPGTLCQSSTTALIAHSIKYGKGLDVIGAGKEHMTLGVRENPLSAFRKSKAIALEGLETTRHVENSIDSCAALDDELLNDLFVQPFAGRVNN